MGKKSKLHLDGIRLTEAQLLLMTAEISRVAVEEYKRESVRARQELLDKRLHNTRMLMEKYRMLTKYSVDAVYSASQVEDDYTFEELVKVMQGRADRLTVESIRENAVRARIMLKHIDRMLDYYREYCASNSKPESMRKWDIINHLYIQDEAKSIEELAKMYLVDERTIYRYRNTALKELSGLFFASIEDY